MLNKFPIIQNHFILITKEWKAQDHLLDPDDLAATYACLNAWSSSSSLSHENEEEKGKDKGKGKSRLFAFYNSGPESGASQPHRHVQFLPVEAMMKNDGSWEPLIDYANNNNTASFENMRNLPFAHFARSIPPNPSAETLHSIYLSLYKAAVTAAAGGDKIDTIIKNTASIISYNLSMTVSTMLLCPRRSEKAVIASSPSSSDIASSISINGTILAGTLLVKTEREWDLLRRRPQLLSDVLGAIGYPTNSWSSAL